MYGKINIYEIQTLQTLLIEMLRERIRTDPGKSSFIVVANNNNNSYFLYFISVF
jgi:hypothetical protein